jgi:hypothetical protein
MGEFWKPGISMQYSNHDEGSMTITNEKTSSNPSVNNKICLSKSVMSMKFMKRKASEEFLGTIEMMKKKNVTEQIWLDTQNFREASEKFDMKFKFVTLQQSNNAVAIAI